MEPTHPSLLSCTAGSCAHVPGAVYIQHAKARVGKKEAMPLILEINTVITECCSDHRVQTQKWPAIVFTLPPMFQVSPPVTFKDFKGLACFCPSPFIFLIFPFWEPNIEDRTSKVTIYWRKLDTTVHVQRKVQIQKGPEETLRVNLTLILDTEILCSILH